MEHTVVFRGTKEEMKRILRTLPDQLAHGPEGEEFRHGIAKELLGCIHDNFMDKSRGGSGVDGVPWEKLAESTAKQKHRKKLYGGVSQADRRTAIEAMRIIRKLENRLRKGVRIRRSTKKILVFNIKTLRRLGGTHRKPRKYSTSNDILIETHDLERSLNPNLPGAKGQILNYQNGQLEVGTSEKTWHHDPENKGFIDAKNPQKHIMKEFQREVVSESQDELKGRIRGLKDIRLTTTDRPLRQKLSLEIQTLEERLMQSEDVSRTETVREVVGVDTGSHPVPVRPFWPKEGGLPEPWAERLSGKASELAAEIVARSIGRQ